MVFVCCPFRIWFSLRCCLFLVCLFVLPPIAHTQLRRKQKQMKTPLNWTVPSIRRAHSTHSTLSRWFRMRVLCFQSALEIMFDDLLSGNWMYLSEKPLARIHTPRIDCEWSSFACMPIDLIFHSGLFVLFCVLFWLVWLCFIAISD